MTDESAEILHRMDVIDQGCKDVEKVLKPLRPEMQCNVLVNLLADLVSSTPNPPLVLGMLLMGLSQAISMKCNIVQDVDLEEERENVRKSAH